MKKYFGDVIGTFVGLAVAILGSEKIGYPLLFWFLGGAVMGLSGWLFLVPKEKRSLTKVVTLTFLTGIAVALVYYLANSII